MTNFTENFETFAELQKQGLEPVRHFTGVAVNTFEKIARTNYALYGDVLDFAVKQARLPVEVSEPKALFERQVATSKEFVELLSTRASEYVQLGQEFQETAATVIEKDFVEPVKKSARTTTKKAA